jgi:multiple antibiotic resistance protein
MFCVYAILRITEKIEKLLGAGLLYMLKKFFGIILLAISIKLFTSNITLLIGKFVKATDWSHILD